MRRIVAAVGVAAAAVSLALPAVATAAPEAPPQCGNYREAVPDIPDYPYHAKFYWGNCTDSNVQVDIWTRTYAFQSYLRTVCAPAQSATLVGESRNHLVSAQWVAKTGAAC